MASEPDPVWEAPDHRTRIRPSRKGWIDFNGHLNMAFYNVLFDRGVSIMFTTRSGIGVGLCPDAQSGSCFTLEVHVNYLDELTLGDPVAVSFQLIDFDPKRLHFFQTMTNSSSGELAATSEQLALHVDMTSRRSAPFPENALGKIESLQKAHLAMDTPEQLGRVIGIRRKPE